MQDEKSPYKSDFGSNGVRIGELAQALEMSVRVLRRMADAREIPSSRTRGKHRVFDIHAVRTALGSGTGNELGARPIEPNAPPNWRRSYALPGLAEDSVWRDMVDALQFDEQPPAAAILRYGFTEMLNNAIDHSGGTAVDIWVWINPDVIAFRIADNGEGVFTHLRKGLRLVDDLEAIAELTKGKRTTWKERHTGEGIFFTSKQVDVFQLTSNKYRWTVDNNRGDHAVGQSSTLIGTVVYGEVAANTTRSMRRVFQQYSENYEFVRSRPVVKLFGLGLSFVSRSEAKRLLDGLEDFTDIDLDFGGVEDIGQGFVDEMLRVWPADHPGKRITPINMNEAVEFMVRRGLPGPSGRSSSE